MRLDRPEAALIRAASGRFRSGSDSSERRHAQRRIHGAGGAPDSSPKRGAWVLSFQARKPASEGSLPGISQQAQNGRTGVHGDFMNSIDIAGNYLDIRVLPDIFTALLKS